MIKRVVTPIVVVGLVGLLAMACGKSTIAPDAAGPPSDTAATVTMSDVSKKKRADSTPPDAAPAGAPDEAPDVSADAAPAGAPDAAPAGAPDAAPDVSAGDVEPPMPLAAWTLSPPAAVPAPTATSGACIPELMQGSKLSFSVARGRKLELCRWGDEPNHAECWSLDLDTGVLAIIKPSKEALAGSKSPLPTLPKEVKVTARGAVAKVCLDNKCVPLDLKGLRVYDAGVHAGRVFVAAGMDELGKEDTKAVRVFDATTGAELSALSFGEIGSHCPQVYWAGDVIYLEAGVCAGPGAVGKFYDPVSGKELALLGGTQESASAWNVKPVVLPSGVVAFREQYGRGLFFHDGKTGALVKRMNLLAALVEDASGEPSMAPEEGWMVAATTPDNKSELVVGNGAESRRRVLLIDPEAQTITRVFELTSCP